MSPPSTSTDATAGRFFWRFSLRDGVVLSLIAALVFLTKTLVKIPLHIPGHSGMVWIALMVVGAGLVRRPGAGLVIGLVAGLLVTLFGFGRDSLLEWAKYAAAGLTLDVVGALLGNRFDNPIVAAIAGGAAHLAKLVTMVVIGLLLRLPAAFLGLGLGLAATTHLVFGVVGGIVGAFLVRELRRVPGLRREEGP
jgi:hypothetical protein